MPFFSSTPPLDENLPKHDRGSGSLSNYVGVLMPRNAKVTMRLAGSDAHQDELANLHDEAELSTATAARTTAEEGVDAPIEVRLFSGRRVSGVVGRVPRGLESAYDEAVRRLDGRGDKPRVPVTIVKTKHGYRVDLLMGLTR
mgnify:CR=1 FL=1